MAAETALQRTPLYDLHLSRGGKMVPFAGYEMPVQYKLGIIKEHLHTRAAAGFFDIAHMGQILIEGDADIRERCEVVFSCDLSHMPPGAIRYSFLLNEHGGVLDDLMITRPLSPDKQNMLFIVVNASCKEQDYDILKKLLPSMKVTLLTDRALIALQGPQAAETLASYCDAPQKLKFMQGHKFSIPKFGDCIISRSGYTGEDGFEISVPNETVQSFAESLLAQPGVEMIGLGARDSLRLEAGLCLYGHELDPNTTPVEADLLWAIPRGRRRTDGFIGSITIQKQIAEGVVKKRVAIKPETRTIAREKTEICDVGGKPIGIVTSGGFGPSVDGPIALGYVETSYAIPDTPLQLMVRGNAVPARVTKLPFVPHRYLRG